MTYSSPDQPYSHAPMQHVPRKSSMPTILAAVALVVALGAVALNIFRNPLGSPLGKYDFSTPKSSLESELKIEADADIRAMIEMQSKVRGKKIREKLNTLDVKKEVEFQGKKVLFISYKENGVAKYETVGLEKDADTGFWTRKYVGTYEVEKENKDLAAQMNKWTASGQL